MSYNIGKIIDRVLECTRSFLGSDKERIRQLEQDLRNEKKKNIRIKRVLSQIKKNNVAFDDVATAYGSILKAMFKCNLMNEMMEDYGIIPEKGEKEIRNIILMASLLGEGTSFSDILIYYVLKKAECREEMTADERQFYLKLNEFYEDKYGEKEFVVIPQKGDLFNEACMSDIEGGHHKFVTVSKVYVPAFCDNLGNVKYKAVVKGQ